MQTTHHTVITKSGDPAEIEVSAATTDAGQRMFVVHVLAGTVTSLTDISAWEATPPRSGAGEIDTEASKEAVDHISQIVAEPPEEMVAPRANPQP